MLATLCFRFPTNRIFFWVGPKRVCGGRWGGVVPCGAVCRLCYMLVPFLHRISHKSDFVSCWLQKGLQVVGGPHGRNRCWRGRSRMLHCRSKSLLGPARSRMCARNRSSDLFWSPHASGLWPRICPYMQSYACPLLFWSKVVFCHC